MKNLLFKCLACFGAIFILVFFIGFVFDRYSPVSDQVKFGVTFSPAYAKYLHLDWQKVYIQILDELKVKNLRITGYWDILEPVPDSYDFKETDFMLDEAGKRNAQIILVLGARQPRWPECHIPAWVKKLTLERRQQKLLEFVKNTVDRYKDRSEIRAWQVENEPMLTFGENCDIPDKSFLQKEVESVRKLSNKPVIMTDSGELGLWTTSMKLSDIFGTTIYREVYNQSLGYATYPLPPYFYSIKSSFIRNFFAKKNKKTIIAELQSEPWLVNGALLSPDQQTKIFTITEFRSYIIFAERTGFDEAYLWGVEWWYFMAAQGHPEYIEYAKTLFR